MYTSHTEGTLRYVIFTYRNSSLWNDCRNPYIHRTLDCALSFGVRVCSPEHFDLSLVQHFMNFLWHGYVDRIFLGSTKRSCHFALLQVSKISCLRIRLLNMLKQSKQNFQLSSDVENRYNFVQFDFPLGSANRHMIILSGTPQNTHRLH